MNKHNLPVVILMFVGILLTACTSAVQAAPSSSKAVPANWTTIQDTSLPSPITFSFGPGWISQDGIDIIHIINTGNPPVHADQWWGAGIVLVDGALVNGPANVILTEVSNQPAVADKSKFIPWPTDFFAYLTALPGVKVIQGPEKVTIGGIQGSQIIMDTPILHPILWLKDDSTWLGGGETGYEPASRRYMILLNVHGEHLLLKFDDDPTTFDAHLPLVQAIFNSIQFGK